jgi:hypothetical protein
LVTSPIAKMLSTVDRLCSSTTTAPLSRATPASARPRLSVLGTRPVEPEFQTLHQADLEQAVANRQIVTAQDVLRAVHDDHVRAELVEDAGELVGDIARARDQDAPGKRVEVEYFVAGDAMLCAGEGGDSRARTDRDEDALGSLFGPIAQADAMRAGDDGALVDDLDAVVLQRLGIGAVDPVDLLQHVVAQRLPVERALIGHLPAETLGVLQVLGEMRAVDQQLLGHAATDHAGAADAIFLRHRHPGAVRRGNAAGARATRPCADDEEVVIVVGHQFTPVSAGSAGSGRDARQSGRGLHRCK